MELKGIKINCSYFVCGNNYKDLITISENDFENIILFKTKDRLNPITINKDVLLKIGFKEERKEFKFYHNFNTMVLYSENELSFFTRSIHSDFNEIRTEKTFKYVHEIQSFLFELTNKPLQILKL